MYGCMRMVVRRPSRSRRLFASPSRLLTVHIARKRWRIPRVVSGTVSVVTETGMGCRSGGNDNG